MAEKMALLYIDTNVFLDFYQASNDRLKVFGELVTRADRVVLTEQTVKEFRRNRAARLADLARNIEQGASPRPFTTTVVRELQGFNRWVQLRDEYERQAKSIAASVREWSTNEASDVVLTEFNNLISACQVLPITESNIEKAHRRKLLGEPPTSPDKHTIGDELIWETLIEGCNQDLIIVSRDKTFQDNASILTSEFSNPYRSLLLVTGKLSDALQSLHIPSAEIEDAEKIIEATRPIDSKCPHCGGKLAEAGYDGSDGDEMWWIECEKCGQMFFPIGQTGRF